MNRLEFFKYKKYPFLAILVAEDEHHYIVSLPGNLHVMQFEKNEIGFELYRGQACKHIEYGEA